MKFGIAKLPKTSYKNTEKKLKRKKNYSKELSSIENRKSNTNRCYDSRKKFCHLANSRPLLWGPEGPCHHFGSLKILVLEHHATTRKPITM